ncbi:MAG: hypothetical protein M0Z64_08065 [Nitrospiraceae bacterium]|nr:hypothetical protein [Nitrospiraceae bacterium]
MNKDIRINIGFPTHTKTRKLIRRLGHKGFYSLVCIWCYAAITRPKGILYGMTAEDIAITADWDDDPNKLITALIECGFLDKPDNGEVG